MDCSTPGFPVLHYLLEFAQIHVHWASDAIQSSHPLSSPSPPAFNLSQHEGLFKWVSYLHQVTKILELYLQHQSFQWIFRLISFRIDWFDPLASKGFSSLVQHHSSKASILRLSAFFIVQLSHPYMTTGSRGTDLNRDLGLKQDFLQGPEHMGAGSSWIHSSHPLWASLPLLLLLCYLSPTPELKCTIRHLNTVWTCMTDSGFTILLTVLVWWNKPGNGVQDKHIPVLEGNLEHLSSYLILEWEVSCPSIKTR